MNIFEKIALPFTSRKRKNTVPVILIHEKDYKAWLRKAPKATQARAKQSAFNPDHKKTLLSFDAKGALSHVYTIASDTIGLYDLSSTVEHITSQISEDALKAIGFTLEPFKKISDSDLTNALIGWGMAGYKFDHYKSKKSEKAILVVSKNKATKRAQDYMRSMMFVRDLINTPANDMGPEQLERAAKKMAQTFGATTTVIKDKKLQEKNFPVIYAVGAAAASDRRPRLIDIKWGKANHSKLTLVGKGVCFDTGGLDLKPSQYMKFMKKDMGGAAHVLGLASMIMAANLPVQLRILIPAVENAVAGEAFRPGDIFKSRKGHFIENTNTDAEGRLVLADSLTYACEKDPELIIDFATLTGSARAALGQDIPAMFSTHEKTARDLQKTSISVQDPLWNMPLWQDYKSHIKNATGDLVNSAGLPGDLIYSALFLQQFISDKQEWIHIDCFAWESAGRPGRAKGGKDTGMRALFAYLEQRYGA